MIHGGAVTVGPSDDQGPAALALGALARTVVADPSRPAAANGARDALGRIYQRGVTSGGIASALMADTAQGPISPVQFAELIDRLVAAGLVRRTRLFGTTGVTLTKQGRAALTLVPEPRPSP